MFSLITNHPLATESPDYAHSMQPGVTTGGPVVDNSKWPAFNRKLYALPPFRNCLPRVLDLGCSGGGFVEDCITDGCEAVGLEGTDFSLRTKRAAWAKIPNNLFTCDVTKPFQVLYFGRPAVFSVVTAWEFMEHIAQKDLPDLCANVRRHLAPDGIWVMSVSTAYGPPYHQTVEEQPWWENFFHYQGFRNLPDIVRYFGDDWVRGPKQGAEGSFHLVLQRVQG